MSILKSSGAKDKMPLLPLRDIVVFPHMIVPLFVGRDKSVRALELVMEKNKKIVLVTQKSATKDDPAPEDLYRIGVVGNILQLLKLPDGTVKVLVEGLYRVKLDTITEQDGFLSGTYIDMEEPSIKTENLEGLSRAVLTQFEQYVKLNKKIPPEVVSSIGQIDDLSKMADTIASHLVLKIEEKQKLLEMDSIAERLETIFASMESEIDVLEVEKRVRSRVKKQMEKTPVSYTHLTLPTKG